MSEQNNGGPAFPLPSAAYKEPIPGDTELFGMTLRDYFAAKAMPSLLVLSSTNESAALEAYKVADAMIKARG